MKGYSIKLLNILVISFGKIYTRIPIISTLVAISIRLITQVDEKTSSTKVGKSESDCINSETIEVN